MKLEQARYAAEKIEEQLSPFCMRSMIAGSIRRGRPECGDIDLVILPRSVEARQQIIERCELRSKRLKGGDKYVVFELPNGFQLDLWFAHNGTADLLDDGDPSNFGVLCLARTGSAMFNVWIAEQASARGLHFNPDRGLLKSNQVVASIEEVEIFKALGIAPVHPKDRER